MNNYTWYIVEKGFDLDSGFKKFAFPVRVSNNNNLHGYFDNLMNDYNGVKGYIISINACKTKKIAQETSEAWNINSKGNGVYLFS